MYPKEFWKKLPEDKAVAVGSLQSGHVVMARSSSRDPTFWDPYSQPLAVLTITSGGFSAEKIESTDSVRCANAVGEQFWVRGVLKKEVLTVDLQCGDFLHRCVNNLWQYQQVRSKPILDGGRWRFDVWDWEKKSRYSELRHDYLAWSIIRPFTQAHASLPASKHIPDFPHTCTRCGGRAYVGLFEVTHEARNTTCPARRA